MTRVCHRCGRDLLKPCVTCPHCGAWVVPGGRNLTFLTQTSRPWGVTEKPGSRSAFP